MTTSQTLDITTITIEEEMERSYLDYAMSVIVSRAIPDVRDGLKPVHRRILYAMHEAGYDWNRQYRKSARIVGDVMGKYHPHGDSAIYDTLVRMAQDFSMGLTLLDGQGNFGSLDGDTPAAMRYTEVRLDKSASTTLLEDIEKNTVSFVPSYDGSGEEPSVLPARFPNLLVNGSGGIAVGMATNIPPHNLAEVINVCLAYIDNRDITIDEILQIMPGPDFPTGGLIIGRTGSYNAAHTGRGSVIIRSKTHFEDRPGDRTSIIVTEVPYQVNKARMVERIAEVFREKLVEGISELRDESDRDGVRVVIELKKDAFPEIVLNQLFKHTSMQTSFGVNLLALREGRPEQMNVKQVIEAFIGFREEVITKRTLFELNKSRARAHILIGLAVSVANIDAIIEMIRAARDPQIAKEQLLAREWNAAEILPLLRLAEGDMAAEQPTYRLSEIQAKAILELRLQRLTGLEREKISDELTDVCAQIVEYLKILGDKQVMYQVIREELIAVRDEFGVPRRSQIVESELDQNIEDLIQPEEMVVTVTHGGYIKRVPLSTYRAQRRGGKGRSAMTTKEEDFVSRLFVSNTHTPILFFTSKGIVHQQKVYRLPEGTPQSKGRALVNLFPMEAGETVTTIMPMPDDKTLWDKLSIVFATSKGDVRRNDLSDFLNIRANGKIAMKFDDPTERLVQVVTCADTQDLLLATRQGKTIRFPVESLRVFNSRASTGVRGIKLAAGDEVISLSVINHSDADFATRAAYMKWRRGAGMDTDAGEESGAVDASEEQLQAMAAGEEFILTITERGYGKRTSSYEYRQTNRGGTGIANIEMSPRNGLVSGSFPVEDRDQIMLVTSSGQLIRCGVKDIRIVGRKTQGVTIFDVPEGDRVVSVAHIQEDESEEGLDEGAESTADDAAPTTPDTTPEA